MAVWESARGGRVSGAGVGVREEPAGSARAIVLVVSGLSGIRILRRFVDIRKEL